MQTCFLNAQGKPIPWIEAVVGGRSVGVPGVLHALKRAHDKYGKLPWNSLFEDAITLAENGFIVSPRLEKLVSMKFNPGVTKLSPISDYFFPDGEPIKAGQLLVNKPLAKVYRSLAKDGIQPFYQGWIAKNIVNAVQNADIAPGHLTLSDMAGYQSKQQPGICGPYKQYQICGMAPPSSGGVAVIQILSQLNNFDLAKYPVNSVEALHLFTQSSKLAFADRNKYIADSDFVNVPTQALIEADYTKSRAELISLKQDMGKAQAGIPQGAIASAESSAYELPSTSHVSIVDGQRNAISMTTSIEMAFGSAVMVDGFILNNQLTDFSFKAQGKNGQQVANRIEPFKRPRSSMAPMMVFDENQALYLVAGSPGGSRIINYVAQTIIGILDWQLDPQSSIDLPKVTNRNGVTTLERGTSLEKIKSELEALGHKVSIRDLNSGLHVIQLRENKLIGGADPRREGKVMGQ